MKKQVITAVLVITAVILAGIIWVAVTNFGQAPPNNGETRYTYRIIQTYPHDTNAFTEGLVYSNGSLYESTGEYGTSTLRQVDLETGGVTQKITLANQYYGEGLALVDDLLVQLTWKEHTGFVYDASTFGLRGNFSYPTEGWGLTYDGHQLIMSDGTSTLYFLDPSTYERTGSIEVQDANTSIINLNELEYINGSIYANIWLTNQIAVINPQTGQLQATIDLAGIYQSSDPNAVLNGIAYDKQNNRLFVTGKDWPNLYQIELNPQTQPSS
jgi:glutamine cyclotransferase